METKHFLFLIDEPFDNSVTMWPCFFESIPPSVLEKINNNFKEVKDVTLNPDQVSLPFLSQPHKIFKRTKKKK